jgi:hypothetical protein
VTADLPRQVTTLKDREGFRRALAASNLSRAALKVVLQMSCHFNGSTGRCDPGYDTLAKEVGLPLRTVERAAAELRDGGWIMVEQDRSDRKANAQIRLFIPTGLPANMVAGNRVPDCPPKNAGLPAKKRATARQYGGGTEEQFEQFEQLGGEAAANTADAERESAAEPAPPAPLEPPARAMNRARASPASPARDGPTPQPSTSSAPPQPGTAANGAGVGRPGDQAYTALWRAYPNHTSQNDAPEVFQKLLAQGVDPDVLIAAAAEYAKRCEGTPPERIKLLCYWLRVRGWEDENRHWLIDERGHARGGRQ